MPTTVKLQEMFSYPIWPIIFLAVAALGLGAWILYNYYLRDKLANKKEEKIFNKIVKTDDPIATKGKYIGMLDALARDCANGMKKDRECFQCLSVYLRGFITEMTGINVRAYTLKDMSKLNNPNITEMIRNYYEPEFAEYADGEEIFTDSTMDLSRKHDYNAQAAISQARMVVERWN